MDDDDDLSINASPTGIHASSYRKSQRLSRRDTRNLEIDSKVEPATGTQLECAVPNQTQLHVDFDRDERLFEADRLDCLRAQQEPLRVHAVPASKRFLSLQFLLESQQLPTIATNPEPAIDPEEHAKRPATGIVQVILQDFCSSPSYVEEELPSWESTPWFRFRNKKIRTYYRSRRRNCPQPTAVELDDDDDEDRLSCSSELSVQEDYTTQVPINKHCNFDMNSSQLICENLQNLSAFFSMPQNNANSSIDLPADVVLLTDTQNAKMEAIVEPSEQQEDATDILKNIGYRICNTEECKYLNNCDKTMDNAEFTLFGESTSMPAVQDTSGNDNKQHDTHFCVDWFGADFSEELKKSQHLESKNASPSKDILDPDELPKETENQQLELNDCKQLDMLLFSEWQPMDGSAPVAFRTASNKIIEVSEERQKDAAKLMSDLEASCSQTLKESDLKHEPANQLDMIPISEWQPMDIPENVAFRTASNKAIEVSEDQQKEAAKLMSDLEASCSQTLNETIDTNIQQEMPFTIEFRTASNKTVKLTEEMRKKAATLMADLEYKTENLEEASNDCNQLGQNVELRTASNKDIELTEQMQRAALNLKADLKNSSSKNKEDVTKTELLDGIPLSEWQNVDMPEVSNLASKTAEKLKMKSKAVAENTNDCNQLEIIQFSEWQPMEMPNSAEFRTAANKVIEVSEEQQIEAAKLMDDLKASCSQTLKETSDKNMQQEISLKIEFRTASNKTVELTDEMRKKAAMLMADLEYGAASQQEPKNECNQAKKLAETVETLQEIKNDTEMGIPAKPSEVNKGPMKATPNQLKLEPLSHEFETPKCTPEMHISLTQLTERSPLDNATKSSIITRRNLLSLNKRRKLKKDAENCGIDAGHTPTRRRFAPMATAASTPMPKRNENVRNVKEQTDLQSNKKERSYSQDSPHSNKRERSCSHDSPPSNKRDCVCSHDSPQSNKRDRSCSHDSPRVQRDRVGKRRSEEALSPIYAPTTKTRRLGLSRVRSKVSQDI